MATSSPTVECGTCGHVLDERTDGDPAAREPCPGCGGRSRLVKVAVHDSVTLHSSIRLVHKGERPGVRGHRLLEVKSGDTPSADGTWADVTQVVDRVNRRYRKRVVKSDGAVVRDVDEPLEDHRGYGSARQSADE